MNRRLYSILGNSQKLDGGAMFGNAPRALWERWAAPDARNRIDLACRALLIREPNLNILLETGIGASLEPKLKDRYGVQEADHVLLSSLAKIGLSHEDIDVVVLSHLHFDHAGGMLSAWGPKQAHQLLFPNATIIVGSEAWERACTPHPRDKASFIPELQVLLEQCGRLEILTDSQSTTLGPGYRFHQSYGHTPGMILCEVEGSLGPIVFAADLIPGRAWVHRSITMGYDRFPERLVDEKVALMNDLAERGGRVFFTHDPSCAIARITKDEQGRFGSTGGKASLSGELA